MPGVARRRHGSVDVAPDPRTPEYRSRAAGHLSGRGDIQVLALPFKPPSFAVQQHWHRSVHKEPRNQWLRSQIYNLFAGHSANWSTLERQLYGRTSRN